MKTRLLAILLLLPFLSIGQQYQLVNATDSNITIDIQVPAFQTRAVTTPLGEALVITASKAMNRAEAGNPDLPMLVIPTMVGNDALMQVQVVSSEYTEYENMEIAPSKGDFPRSINPDDVPYTYGEAYRNNAFFPSQLAKLDEPYIHRDVRGQNLVVYPYAYNPVTKVLRVYDHLVVSMDRVGNDTRNVINRTSKSFVLDPEFKAMYESRYINYSQSTAKYTPIEENGELLIICHDAFMTAMEPFVAWKKQIGRPTTMVGTNTTGNTAAAIKTYVQNYYDSHPNLTDLLLVGDVAQIPGTWVSAGTGAYGYSGYGDLPYGQLAGNDFYNEVIVGRFCCENEAQVTNHVNKVLNYERDLDASATWLSVGQGVSTNSQGGHFGESDYQHIDNIRTDLLNYNYTNVYRDYQGVSGSTAANAAAVSQHINEGVSIINYCNHGSETSWGVFSYSNSHVNALTNDYKLPYVISVACLNGKYDRNGDCFAEAWMRATNNSNGNPTGAIGGMFSYIEQPWTPPQYGQDEMIDILVESYANNIKRTMGGVSINGNLAVLDLGATQNPNKGTYNCWILFGDPTLTLRNATPANMSVSHAPVMDVNATSFAVSATDGEGALATLTRNGEIMGSATIENGTANIQFSAPATPGEATLTVFGYNKVTYQSTVNIISGGVQTFLVTVSANPDNGGTVSGGGYYIQGQSCTVTATANSGFTFTSWTEDGTVVSTSANYSFTVTGNRTLLANFTQQQFTITTLVEPMMEAGGVQGGGTYTYGQSCTLTATPCVPFSFANWTKNGIVVGTNPTYTFQVTESATYVAHFELLSYTVTATANPTEGGIVTGHGIYSAGYECILTATANEGYDFVNWTEGGNVVSTDETYAFIVDSDRNLTANFQLQTFEVSITIDPIEAGTATGEGTYNYGDEVTLTVERNEDYGFLNWTEEGEVVSEETTYVFTITGNRHLTANFIHTEGVDEQQAHANIYPNPTSGLVTIKAEGLRQITVANTMGQVLLLQEVATDEVSINLSTFGNGMYLINVTTTEGSIVKRINVIQ